MLKKMMDAILLSCQKATALIAVRSFRKLGKKEQLQLNMHLKMCHACRKFSDQSDYIDHAVDFLHQHPELMKKIKLSEEQKQAMQKRIDQKA